MEPAGLFLRLRKGYYLSCRLDGKMRAVHLVPGRRFSNGSYAEPTPPPSAQTRNSSHCVPHKPLDRQEMHSHCAGKETEPPLPHTQRGSDWSKSSSAKPGPQAKPLGSQASHRAAMVLLDEIKAVSSFSALLFTCAGGSVAFSSSKV